MVLRNLTNEIKVSALCLGTMTWGEQNTEEEAYEQIDYALDRGVNFFDTAELYPVPPNEKTYTRTESIIGRYMKARGNRDEIILATKVAGKAPWTSYIRNGGNQFDKKNITEALDGSLKRLGTDYIDLYQLHWPDRKTNFFGQLGFKYPSEDSFVSIEETLEVLNEIVKSGKVRAVGLSNETPWGMMNFLHYAKTKKHVKVATTQNPYSLLNRVYEIGNAEISYREGVGLLAYSPLAFGVLSGKYLGGKRPEGARLTLFGGHFKRYSNDFAISATAKYLEIAKKYNMSLTQMALAYVTSRPFVTSNIIGATTLEQLKENIDSIDVEINKEIEKEIDAVHIEIPNPSP